MSLCEMIEIASLGVFESSLQITRISYLCKKHE